LARTFDQISREDGRLWPATDVVRWLADEWRASAEPKREPVSEASIRSALPAGHWPAESFRPLPPINVTSTIVTRTSSPAKISGSMARHCASSPPEMLVSGTVEPGTAVGTAVAAGVGDGVGVAVGAQTLWVMTLVS
jgi:hypothetical protein